MGIWRRALIVGLGKSGLASARLLKALEVENIRGYDRRAYVADLPPGLEPFLGDDSIPDRALTEVDLVVLSPGVPPDAVGPVIARVAPDADIRGELSLALEVLQTMPSSGWSPRPTILVTGTNGKSTVTAMIGALLHAGGLRAFTGGNLGTPLSTLLADAHQDPSRWPEALVLECSSFQLETMDRVPCDVAMIVNVSPDHLDRYPTVDDYAATKARIFTGLRPDGLGLLYASDPWTSSIARTVSRDVVLVDGDRPPRVVGSGAEEILEMTDGHAIPRRLLALPGRHNAVNALFAVMAARHLGITETDCRSGLGTFRGLPHRMEWIRELDDVAYYDDSKATNVAAVVAGLDGFDRPVVLIAGGVRKNDDLSPLRTMMARNGRALVAIGSSKDEFSALVRDVVPVVQADTMHEAVARARQLAATGDAVVLAPACASFDQFRDYAHRGDAFADAVRNLG